MWREAALTLAVAALTVACSERATPTPPLVVADDIVARRAQFVPMTLDADLSRLAPGDLEAMRHLVDAARVVDQIFLRQAWAGNPAFAPKVAALTGADAQAAKDYYRIMYGPWDRLAAFEPFLGHQPHPEGAGFYPEDMTAAEFDAWLTAHPDDRPAFTSLTTVIRRAPSGLVAVPYREAYREQLEQAAGHLRAAAAATDNASLKHFLELRADAFSSDDSYESDVAWMDLDSDIEVVIGPYETYEDRLYGYKAAFEAFLCVTQPEDSARLALFKSELPFLERNLPIPDEDKNFERGTESPIHVADEVLTAGDARAGVQTLAFNLPNDERVREAKGSKKVLLKNMMRAKFDAILTPIAARVLPADELDRLGFEAYYQFTLHHELSHGLGPGRITVDGRVTEVRLELKDLYSALEEAKADVLGVYDIYALANKGVMDAAILQSLPWTYTAGLFRSARFGTTEAHGLGVVMQASFLLEKGALEVTAQGRLRPVPERFPEAIRELAHVLLMVQARGDYSGAKALVAKYGTVPPAMQTILDGLSDIPVDVDPEYPLTGLGG